MKNTVIQLCVVLLAITGIHAMRLINENKITGRVASPDALTYVWAIHANDSIIAPVSFGKFSIKVKPGTWKLLLHTNNPYKDMVIDDVVVSEGKSTNLGEIKLLQ